MKTTCNMILNKLHRIKYLKEKVDLKKSRFQKSRFQKSNFQKKSFKKNPKKFQEKIHLSHKSLDKSNVV